MGEKNEAMDEETTEEAQQQPSQPPHQPNQQQQNVNIPSHPSFDGQFKDLRCLHTAIDICFVEAWSSYLFQAQSNKIDIQLLRFATKKLHTDATEAAQAEIDAEPTVDRALLQDLIK
eukprot:7060084-Ditylum_brightwellii.AAC.1